MKVSKQILSLIIAGSAVAVMTTSCKKEDVKPNDNDRSKTEKCKKPDYCEACGMG